MKMKFTVVILWALAIMVLPLANVSQADLINGDFSQQLTGWSKAEDFNSGDYISSVYEENGYANLETQGFPEGPNSLTLSQWFEIPISAYTLSFDIGIKRISDDQIGEGSFGFYDNFSVYYLGDSYSDDRDFMGVEIDPPIEENGNTWSSTPYDPTDGNLDLESFDRDGLDWYHFVADISDLAGRSGELFFELFDEDDGCKSLAYVDNVSINPVPEPATMLLVGSGLLTLIGMACKRRKN